jgi:O-antigen/teichoic acid export membrane protein
LEKAEVMVIILIVNFAISFPLSIYSSILQAYERFVIVKAAGIARSLLIPLITLPFLFFGYGAVLMLLVTTIVNILILVFQCWYALKKIKIKFKFVKMEAKFVKEIFGFSFFIFLNVIVDLIYWNTDQFILGITSGTQVVAIYAIAMQFVTIYKKFSTSISNLFLPQASRLIANNVGSTKITNLMVKYGRIQFLILSFILSGFFLFGYQFISIWAGDNYSDAYYIVLIIMIPLIIPLTQNFGIAVLQAKNEQKFRAVTYLLIAIINIIISIPLAIKFGGIGIAAATALSLILGHIIIMNIYYHKKININMVLYWRNILKVLSTVILITIIGLVFDRLIFESDSILMLVVRIIIYSFIFVVGIWFSVLNQYEKNLFKSIGLKIIRRFYKRKT